MSAVSVDCLRNTVIDINQEQALAFVLVVGDLLQDGEWENAQVAKRLLDQLSVPYYLICGNHDFAPIPQKRRQGFHYLSVEAFVKFFNGHGFDHTGKRYYAHQTEFEERNPANDSTVLQFYENNSMILGSLEMT